MKKALISVLLCVSILVSCVLVSCVKEEQSLSSETQTESTVEASAESEEVSELPKGLVPHLPSLRWDGRELTVLTATKPDVYNFSITPFGADEIIDEPVNDAIVERNEKLFNEYGFVIKNQFDSDFDVAVKRVRDDLSAGTVTYDVIDTGLTTLCTLASEGSFLDLYTIENSYLELDQNWWDHYAIDDISIANKLFFATGDILLEDDEYTYCVYYNKDIIDEYGLESPEVLALNHQWTLDKMYEYCKVAAKDDGDGKMEPFHDDVWGGVSILFSSQAYIAGCGCLTVVKDADDIPSLSMLNDRNVSAALKVAEMMGDHAVYAYTEYYENNGALGVISNFEKGKALFYQETVSLAGTEAIRNANFRYGILPMPLYNEEQERYTSNVNPFHFYCVSILNTCEDTEFVTFALEAIAYMSKQLVTPAYYELTLKNKRILDAESSAEILDIIFSNRVVDIAVAFNWGGCNQYAKQIIDAGGASESYIQSKEGTFNEAMQQTLDLFLNMD